MRFTDYLTLESIQSYFPLTKDLISFTRYQNEMHFSYVITTFLLILKLTFLFDIKNTPELYNTD